MTRDERQQRGKIQDEITLLRASAAATRSRDPEGARHKQNKANRLEKKLERMK